MSKLEATYNIESTPDLEAVGGKFLMGSSIHKRCDLIGAIDSVVFDPGGGNQKKVLNKCDGYMLCFEFGGGNEEMMEAEFDECMLGFNPSLHTMSSLFPANQSSYMNVGSMLRLEEQVKGDQGGGIFLQPLIFNFSSYIVNGDLKLKLDDMSGLANRIIQEHGVIERPHFERRNVFDPGITEGLNDRLLSVPCSSLELLALWLLVINQWMLQHLLASDVHFPLAQRMIWAIAWLFGNFGVG